MLEINKSYFEKLSKKDQVKILEEEINKELEKILNGFSKSYCSCSCDSLRDLIKIAIKGDLGIDLRWIKFKDKRSIRKLAEMIVYRKL